MTRALALLAVLALALAGCGTSADDATEAAATGGEAGGGEGVRVVATVFPLAWLAEQIAPSVELSYLGAGGQDPHDLELTPGDREAMEGADVVLYVGQIGFQPQVEDAVDSASGEVVSAADVIGEDALLPIGHGEEEHADEDDHADEDHADEDHADEDDDHTDEGQAATVEAMPISDVGADEGDDHADEGDDHADEGDEGDDHASEDDHADEGDDHAEEGDDHADEGDYHADEGDDHDDHGELDPHVWFDASLMAEVARATGEAFAAADPDGAEAYTDAAETVAADLEALDEEIATTLGDCDHDEVVVGHEAYAYLLEPHGLHQEGVSGAGGHADASPQRIAELTEFIRDEGIPAVLTEPVEGRSDAEAVAREAGVELVEIYSLDIVTDEQYEAGYPDLLREQAAAVAQAAGCQG